MQERAKKKYKVGEQNNMDPLTRLRNAIIIQAADDYRMALKKGNAYYQGECETFFRSKYFKGLVDIDGEYLIRKIREEIIG